MKKIILFDTSVATLNLGDEIINVSIKSNWPELYGKNYIIKMPTHTPSFHWWQNIIAKRNRLYENVDYKFLCGTNIIYTNMFRPEPAWNIFLHNTRLQKGTICLGVGIGRNSKTVNAYTKKLYKKILNTDFVHSTRDAASCELLMDWGFRAVNTACPTMWNLDSNLCQNISNEKSNSVVFTLTGYQPNYLYDKKMIDILRKNYENLYFWPQTYEDFEYLKMIDEHWMSCIIVPPNIEGYSALLKKKIDYVGNRLHGGIFALQHACRTIIIAIDYRAQEIQKNFSIPCISRQDIESLDEFINFKWKTQIKGLNFDIIREWKSQFDF